MFGLPGGTEWILLVLIVLLLFGSARLPRLARSMREAREEFKKESAPKKGSPVPEAHTDNPEPADAPAQGDAPDPPA
jgi:sec-independent protein translocase protein TatA